MKLVESDFYGLSLILTVQLRGNERVVETQKVKGHKILGIIPNNSETKVDEHIVAIKPENLNCVSHRRLNLLLKTYTRLNKKICEIQDKPPSEYEEWVENVSVLAFITIESER